MAGLNPTQLRIPNHIIKADYAHTRHIYGTGVGIAVLDTGITPRTDFQTSPFTSIPVNRIQCFQDFVNFKSKPYDDSGHGTHICGKIASAQRIGDSEYLGIAPGCNLIVLKVLDKNGNAPTSTFLQALRWILEYQYVYHIQIVNISIGTQMLPGRNSEHRLLTQAVERLWEHGMIVCASAGNNGPSPGTISAPGNCCKIITVGASDDNLPSLSSGFKRNYSGRGPAGCSDVKPEIVAPGSQIISCSNHSSGYSVKTGTSMSTALVSGAIALLLEQEPYLTNQQVKNRLHSCARRLRLPHFQQGWGLLDISRLLETPSAGSDS